MADHHHPHREQHRPNRLSVPSRAATSASRATTTPTTRTYPNPFTSYNPSSTPLSTPSKHRISSSSSSSSLSFLFILLFSLRSLYSLLPFLRSSPSSISLFPFSFLVSLLSFLLTLSFSLLSFSLSSKKLNQPIFSLGSLTPSQHKLFFYKSVLLSAVFLLRFQSLRYCTTSAMIIAELSGHVAARLVAKPVKVRGLFALLVGLFLLSISWDRTDCFPFSSSLSGSDMVFFREGCVRVFPMLLPFLSGFLGCYERVSLNWGAIRQLGSKRIRLISLFYTMVVLFVPAVISIIVFEIGDDSVSVGSLGWPLANTVVFGVLLSENLSDGKLANSKDFRREFVITIVCTVVLELFYFPELSLWGLLFCGFLIWIAVRELDPGMNYVELGLDSSSESIPSLIMKPIRHILNDKKSRKISLFLLINAAYMVVEFVVGFMSNSLGLISDACHMLFDCAALAIGLYASYISRLPANGQFNYGRGRFEVLSGYVNAVFLVLVGVLIVVESFERILDPQEISTNSLLTVSIGGLLVNIVGLIFFHEEHHHAHGGGSASCTHSHSKSHDHQHSLDHTGHDHQSHHDHLEAIHVHDDSERLSIGRVKQNTHCHEHHNCKDHGDTDKYTTPNNESTKGSGHHHDQQDQVHHHHDDHCQHGRHDHHQHDHHDHHQHDHHDHHQHDHHDHDHCQHGHHEHRQHDHHDHVHTHPHSSDFTKPSSISVTQHIILPSDEKLLDKPKKHLHHHIDHNMEGIFLHVLADTMGSVGVVISTLLIKYKGWLAADPACSIFISVLIVSSVIPLLRNSAEILLQRIPKAHEQDMKEVIDDVMKVKGVRDIKKFHVWSFTNTDVVGTLHLQVSTGTDKVSVQADVSHMLHDAGIKDLTLQSHRKLQRLELKSVFWQPHEGQEVETGICVRASSIISLLCTQQFVRDMDSAGGR